MPLVSHGEAIRRYSSIYGECAQNAPQVAAALASDDIGTFSCCFWKQERHSTGLPWVGLNGTVVSAPHSEQVVRVSVRTRALPLARLALHCLQRLGSFLNCLSWKKNCSPAVKMKSAPQSTHFNTRSWNSMAGFPTENCTDPAVNMRAVAVPVPCICLVQTRGPGRI